MECALSKVQNRALVIISMILLLYISRNRQQRRLVKLTIGTRHLFLRALLSGKTGSDCKTTPEEK